MRPPLHLQVPLETSQTPLSRAVMRTMLGLPGERLPLSQPASEQGSSKLVVPCLVRLRQKLRQRHLDPQHRHRKHFPKLNLLCERRRENAAELERGRSTCEAWNTTSMFLMVFHVNLRCPATAMPEATCVNHLHSRRWAGPC